jgi:hypothetical protein
MKVDLGSCAVCGAKNSTFVEKCYKCGETLPWAPSFVPHSLHSAVSPKVIAAKSDQNAAPSAYVAPTEEEKVGFIGLATRQVVLPGWSLATGGLGCMIFGMLLLSVFGRRETAARVVVTPTAVATPVPTLPPSPAVAPTTAPIVTVTATPLAVAGTMAPTSVPSSPVTPAPGETPITPQSEVSVAPTPAATAPVQNLSFENVFLNTHQGTPEQQRSYWNTIANAKVSWTGTFLGLGSSPGGPLTLKCGTGTSMATVLVNLDTSVGLTLPILRPNQAISVEGNLQSYTNDTYILTQGLVKP